MRRLVLLSLIAVADCSQAYVGKIDSRTFRIEGPGIPGGSSGPNRREAERLCPKGFRVLNEETHRNTTDRANDENGVFTNWTIRCL